MLRTRLRRLPRLQGEGTVTVSRVVGHGCWTVRVGERDVALIDGGLAEPEAEPGPAATAVRVAGSDLILRCAAGQPQSFTVGRTP